MWRYLGAATLISLCAGTSADVKIFYDFEQGSDTKLYPALSVSSDVQMEIVPGGADGTGHCVKITNKTPQRYCALTIKLNCLMEKNLAISFDHREMIEEGKRALYFGILFFAPDNSQWFGSDIFSSQWRHVDISPAELTSPNQATLTLNTPLSHINLYGRADNETPAVMTVWLDNIRIHTDPQPPKMSERVRISYSAAPFFHWGRNLGFAQLHYSPDPSFPSQRTTRVSTSRNWHVPEKLLTPGEYYWCVRYETPLRSGYTPIEKIIIPQEAHRFLGPPLPWERLRHQPYPRLIPAQLCANEKERQNLIARAQSLYQQGVPDDPPSYAPGHPEWPTWIEWYGKVHGGITSRTGVRLRQMAELFVQTQDARVRDWLKEMALKAASWDPLGGSSLRGGDIGFHHLLRGLNWSYDALHEELTPAEREKLRGMIIRRAELFWDYMNPFRFGREYNNHAWLCALALGESGLLLYGEYEAAQDWAQYAYDLYCSLFLCGLGYQGDNNEGIAYWGYGLGFIIQYADMMKHVCQIDLFQHPWLYQTGRFPLYTCPPGAWAVSFADTGMPNHGVRGPAMTRQVKELALRTKDPYALWYAGGTAEEAGFAPKPPLDLPQSIHYRFIGWGLFNTNLLNGLEGVTVAMRSGPFWAGHQHEDQNAFVIHAYGEKLAIDSGYYDWYGSEHFTKYSTLTRAHNAILVNGRDQNSRREGCDGAILKWLDSPGFGYMIGDASDPDMYEGQLQKWARHILFIKPDFVIVHDVLAAAAGPAQFDWLLHAVAPIETSAREQSFALTSGQARLYGQFLQPPDIRMEAVEGFPVEPVDGYSTRPVPPERYVKEWTLWATPAQKRHREDFLTALHIQKLSDKPRTQATFLALPAQNAWGLRIETQTETTEALFRQQESTGLLESAGLTTDGNVAALTRTGLRLVRALCIQGKLLNDGGRNILQASEPVDFAWTANEIGDFVTIHAQKPARLVLRLSFRGEPDVAKAPQAKIQSGKGHWEINVPPGEHEIVWRARRPRIPAAPADAVKLIYYPLPVGTKAFHYWWGEWEARAAGHFTIELENAPSLKSLLIDNQPIDLSGARRLWLKAGLHTMLAQGAPDYPIIRLKKLDIPTSHTTLLPKDYQPSPKAIVVEAEHVAAEGSIQGQIREKVGASGKLAHCVWDTDGQWALWRFTIPQTGAYRLLIRGCSEQEDILRLLEIDPEKGMGRALYTIRLGNTGGWARTTDDWRYFAVPIIFPLAAGEHMLRLERLTGSMNLDCFVFEPMP